MLRCRPPRNEGDGMDGTRMVPPLPARVAQGREHDVPAAWILEPDAPGKVAGGGVGRDWNERTRRDGFPSAPGPRIQQDLEIRLRRTQKKRDPKAVASGTEGSGTTTATKAQSWMAPVAALLLL